MTIVNEVVTTLFSRWKIERSKHLRHFRKLIQNSLSFLSHAFDRQLFLQTVREEIRTGITSQALAGNDRFLCSRIPRQNAVLAHSASVIVSVSIAFSMERHHYRDPVNGPTTAQWPVVVLEITRFQHCSDYAVTEFQVCERAAGSETEVPPLIAPSNLRIPFLDQE